MIRKKVGFIGSGYMGFGMAKNLIKNFDVCVIAHKNREPINKLVNLGAKEILNYNDLLNNNLDCLMMCVTNTPVAVSVAEMIAPMIKEKLLIIDLTTHDKLGTTKMKYIFHSKKITYTVNPVMGGPVQAEEGVLGGIVSATGDNFKLAEPYLKLFCKNYFHFGLVGMGAKSKLLNNFLTLGNAALINHMAKAAKKFDLDLQKLFDVAKLGSGNSAALIRVFEALLQGDSTGFKFTASNSVKDLTYIQDLLKDFPEAEKIAEDNKNYFQKAVDDGYGENFISELIDKK